jgi:aminocarboxymuconate-semialdehyde decarboxylase
MANADDGGAERRLVIDVHSHLHSDRADAMLDEQTQRERNYFIRYSTDEGRVWGRRFFEKIAPKMVSLDERIEDLDRMGIDMQMVTPRPTQKHYWIEAALAEEIAGIENDNVAESVHRHPDRFFGICTLPLQDTDRALNELDRAVGTLGLKGILISTSVGPWELSDPRLEPIWSRAEELDIPFFLHPLGFSHGERFRPFYMINIVGNPVEETLALTHLIMGGVLERHRRLKICIVHGGGYLPFHFGRLDQGYRVDVRPDSRRHISKPPSEYLKQMYYDTVVFDPDEVATLVRRYGVDRVLMATDYPHDLSHDDPVGFIDSVDGLTAADKVAILGGNAQRLFKVGRAQAM